MIEQWIADFLEAMAASYTAYKHEYRGSRMPIDGWEQEGRPYVWHHEGTYDLPTGKVSVFFDSGHGYGAAYWHASQKAGMFRDYYAGEDIAVIQNYERDDCPLDVYVKLAPQS